MCMECFFGIFFFKFFNLALVEFEQIKKKISFNKLISLIESVVLKEILVPSIAYQLSLA